MAWALYELANVGTTTAPDKQKVTCIPMTSFRGRKLLQHLEGHVLQPQNGRAIRLGDETSTRYRYDRTGEFVYPDENYAREIMQLYTIGLHHLNDDGTAVHDKFGRLIQTYSHHDIIDTSVRLNLLYPERSKY